MQLSMSYILLERMCLSTLVIHANVESPAECAYLKMYKGGVDFKLKTRQHLGPVEFGQCRCTMRGSGKTRGARDPRS